MAKNFGRVNVSFENDLGSALGTNHRNLCRWPGKIQICSDVFAVHHIICTAICFASNYCNTWHGGFAESIK
jgi:hypothetical protein